MNFKVFGRFLLIVGALVAAVTMLYRTAVLPNWNKTEEFRLMGEYYNGYQPMRLRIQIDDIRAEREARAEKLLWAAAAGTAVLVLGVGIMLSAKP